MIFSSNHIHFSYVFSVSFKIEHIESNILSRTFSKLHCYTRERSSRTMIRSSSGISWIYKKFDHCFLKRLFLCPLIMIFSQKNECFIKNEKTNFSKNLEFNFFFSESKKSEMDNVLGITWNHKRNT